MQHNIKTIDLNNINPDKPLTINGNGTIATSSVSNTELGYLVGASSNIQTQLNKANQAITYTKTEVDNSLALKAN